MKADNVRPDLRPVEGAAADRELAVLGKALGHATRVAILRALRQRESATCAELVAELGSAQSTISEHVRILREAGLVRSLDHGYEVDVHRVRRLKALVGSL
jgi:DNA-binding transcriptional ArsR family regulator